MKKRAVKSRLDASSTILIVGIVIMAVFLVFLCFISVVMGSAAVLFYALPYAIAICYSALILKRKEVTSVILQRMTILVSLFGTITSVYLMVAFSRAVGIF